MADEGWAEYLRSLQGVAALDEDSVAKRMSFARLLRDHMNSSLAGGEERYGTTVSPESDRYRHLIGMREATLDPEVGGMAAFTGGLGHEVNNLVGALWGGDLKQLGSPSEELGLMQILENSSDDVYNNFIGILSAYIDPETLTEEELMEILSRGTLPPDLRQADASAVMVDRVGPQLGIGEQRTRRVSDLPIERPR